MDAANNSATPQPAPKARTWSALMQSSLAVLLGSLLVGLVAHSLLHGSVQRPSALSEAPLTRLDLNQATRAELQLLPGVGEHLAQRIEAYRILYGPYQSVEELRKVPGIGPLTLERLRPLLVVHATASRAVAGSLKSAPALPRTSQKEVALTDLIDINAAGADDLRKLPGIGPKLSQRIIDTRTQAPFKTIEELRRVPGIGPKTLEKLRPHVTVGTEVASK